MLVADAVRLQPGERLRGIGLALRREPQHAGVVKDRRARGVGKLFPIWERFARHLRIKRVGAVTHADDAARPARRAARVARAIGVEKAHRFARAKQMPRGPRAEHARADDRDGDTLDTGLWWLAHFRAAQIGGVW